MHLTLEFRVIRRGLAVAAAALAAVMGGGAPATVVPLDLEKMVAVADEIVAVRVVDNRDAFDNGIIITHCDVTVLETWKGSMAGDQTITIPGGRYKGMAMEVPSVPRLKEGEDLVLFLSYPERRLPPKAKAALDFSNPLVASPKVVGGWQGKFGIVAPDPGAEKGALSDSASVVRQTPQTASPSEQWVKDSPRLSHFRTSVQSLVNKQKQLETAKAAPVELKGIGSFVVPERGDDPVVRHFDPLPALAYMTEQEVKSMEKALAEELPSQDPKESDQ